MANGAEGAAATADEAPKTFFNTKAGGEKASEDITKPKYNNAGHVDKSKGKNAVKESRKKYAPNADKPTTASADPSKKLPEVVKKVDPQGLSAILTNMMSMLAMVRDTANATSPVSNAKTVKNALAGALAILADEYGFEVVIEVLNNCLKDGGFQQISEQHQETVKEAMIELLKNALENGPTTLRITIAPETLGIPDNGAIPSPLLEEAPDLYIQQYYGFEDPYPGFIQWKGPNGELVYTFRNDEPCFETAEDHINFMAEFDIAEDLRPFILEKNLTPEDLNSILDKNIQKVQNNGMDKSMGKNSGQNIMQLLNMLLGVLGPIINKAKSNHIPQSVMDQGSMNKSLEKFSKNMSIIKKMKDDSKKAFDLPGALSGLLGGNINLGGALSGLGQLGNITGALSGLGGIGNISSLSSLGNIGNMATGLGGLGVSVGGISNIGNILNTVTSGQTPNITPQIANIAVNVGQQLAAKR